MSCLKTLAYSFQERQMKWGIERSVSRSPKTNVQIINLKCQHRNDELLSMTTLMSVTSFATWEPKLLIPFTSDLFQGRHLQFVQTTFTLLINQRNGQERPAATSVTSDSENCLLNPDAIEVAGVYSLVTSLGSRCIVVRILRPVKTRLNMRNEIVLF
jgi:hypothetical protein